jgi:hypothetical protein
MTRLVRLGGRALAIGMVATVVAVAGVASASPSEGSIRGGDVPAKDIVPGQYIVVFKKNAVHRGQAGATANGLVSAFGGRVMHAYDAALSGFSIATDERGARRIAASPNVDFVQAVHWLKATDTQPNPPSWGLDRIDQTYLPTDHQYTYPNTAADVHVFVVDTGFAVGHPDFGARATTAADFIGTPTTSDCYLHGTHVAGTIGGTQMGVAKQVNLLSVRVLDCKGIGTTDSVIQGLNFVGTYPTTLKVVNMSLGGDQDAAVDAAVRNLTNNGVPVVVAAGNKNRPACFGSPAEVREAITVGALDQSDRRADFSNWGVCVDLYAPGVDIVSDNADPNGTQLTLSGTSMAAPHVTGAVAMLLEQHQDWTPAQIQQALVANTYDSRRILNVNGSNPPGPPPAGSWHQSDVPPTGTASRMALAPAQNPVSGRVDAFVASNAVGHPILWGAGTTSGTWSSVWSDLGGVTTGSPTAIWSLPDRLDLFVIGADHSVYHRSLSSGVWTPFEPLGGIVRADLVAVSPEPGVIDLFAIGTDSGVWHRNFDGYEWSGWESFGGKTLNHNFSVAVDPMTGMENIVVQGTDSGVWWRQFDQFFLSPWTPLGGIVRNDVKAVATSDGKIDLFAVGTDTGVWHRRWNRGPWTPWEPLGGLTTGGGVEAVGWDNGFVDLFVRGTNGFIYNRHFNNTSWAPWAPLNFQVATTLPSATSVLTYELAMAVPTSNGAVFAARWN